MVLKLAWLNGFLLILPLLAWNLALGPHIRDPRITSDAHSPKWLLLVENCTRILVFVLPLLMPLPSRANWQFALQKAGLAVYILGSLVYFSSWLPLLLVPASAWSNSPAGLLAPRLTPFLSFLGIAMLGGNWPYAILAAVFIVFHTWHGIQNL
jgi:hypothetical protein